MSLTSLLKRPEVARRFRQEFDRPALGLHAQLAVPPLTKSYALTGIAFDYVLRFYVQKINPGAVVRRWVGEESLDGLRQMAKRGYDPREFDAGAAPKRGERIVSAAKTSCRAYLRTRTVGKPRGRLIEAAIGLAQLDPFYRAGPIAIDPQSIGKIDRMVVRDLNSLIGLVDCRRFVARETCVLNPTFGGASERVGGADADLFIDGTLIEIKTTKEMRLDRRRAFNQLVGYYLLSRIGGIDGCDKKCRIERLGVYYSWYGVLFSFPARQVVQDNRLPSLLRWFAEKARDPEVQYVRLSDV